MLPYGPMTFSSGEIDNMVDLQVSCNCKILYYLVWKKKFSWFIGTCTVLNWDMSSYWVNHQECHIWVLFRYQEIMHVTFSILFFKQLAYTLAAYCYGSKSVTQPDASSKLWDKISYSTNRTQNNLDIYQF